MANYGGRLGLGSFLCSENHCMKDNFSTQSGLYAQFRPKYPAALFDFLYRPKMVRFPVFMRLALPA